MTVRTKPVGHGVTGELLVAVQVLAVSSAELAATVRSEQALEGVRRASPRHPALPLSSLRRSCRGD